MKNKKLLIISIIMMVVGVSLLILGLLDVTNIGRLKGAITDDTASFKVTFTCAKTTLQVDEETTCTTKVDVGSNTITGLQGKIKVNSNLTVVANSYSVIPSGWSSTGTELFYGYSGYEVTGNSAIFSFKVKGATAGTGTVTMEPFDNQMFVMDANTRHDVTAQPLSITVNDSGSGGGSEGGGEQGGGGDTPVVIDNTLSSLSVSPGSLSPAFNKNTTSYSVTVANNVTSITVSATATTAGANIEGAGAHNLNVGANSIPVTVKVAGAEDKTYTINVTRSSDESQVAETDLSSITVNNGTLIPEFDKDVTTYTIVVEPNIAEIGINASTVVGTSNVTGGGTKQISSSMDPIVLTVTDARGNTKTYTLNVVINSSENECILTSGSYTVDNSQLVISKVGINDTDETIASNLSATCGTVTVSDGKVTLAFNDKTIVYTIERMWVPKTGNIRVNYIAILGGIIALVGATLFVMANVKKDNKK